jgi:hypothetical protein
MTDPPGTPGDDIRRPLDESLPSGPPRPPRPPRTDPAPPAGAPAPDNPAPSASGPAESAPLRPAAPAPATPATAAVPDAATTAPDAAAEPVEPAEPATLRPALVARIAGAAATASAAPAIAARALAGWTGRPAGRYTMPALLIAALLGIALSTGAFLVPTGSDDNPDGGAQTAPPGAIPGSPPPTGPPGAAPPLNNPGSVPTGLGNPAESLTGWAEQMQTRTGIPLVALRAYGYAELAVTATTPGCRLSWTTLAAIGRVESNHGSSGGATLLEDGRALPAIIGLPLDGQGDRAEILDTDGGAMDLDPTYDRAVGPMQFIPTTWQVEAVDATGDGISDVHNIHDAALAAANYLCRNGRDLATAEGWWQAVLSYNAVQAYAEAVFAAANLYGQQSRG